MEIIASKGGFIFISDKKRDYKSHKITDTQKVIIPKYKGEDTYDQMLNRQFEETVSAVVSAETYPRGEKSTNKTVNQYGKSPDEEDEPSHIDNNKNKEYLSRVRRDYYNSMEDEMSDVTNFYSFSENSTALKQERENHDK